MSEERRIEYLEKRVDEGLRRSGAKLARTFGFWS